MASKRRNTVLEMPLLDSSYLPPTIFILTHILGIAGVLYWKRCVRDRAGNLVVPPFFNLQLGSEGASEGAVDAGEQEVFVLACFS